MNQTTLEKPTSTQRLLLALIILFASTLSMVVVAFHRADYFQGTVPPKIIRHLSPLAAKLSGGDSEHSVFNDELQYLELALSIARNGSYAGKWDLYRPPVYPAFLAIACLVSGNRLVGLYAIQAMLFVLTLALLYRTALHITGSFGVALLTIGLSSLWLPFYQYIPRLLTENIAMFLVAASLWLVLMAADNPTYKRCAAAGVVIGLAALVKPTILPFVFLAPVLIYLRVRKSRHGFLSAGLVLILSILMILPRTYHNYRVTGCFVPIATGGGLSFYLGNSPMLFIDSKLAVREVYDGSDLSGWVTGDKLEVQKDKALARKEFMRIRKDPEGAAGLFARKFSLFWLGQLGADPNIVRKQLNKSIPHIWGFGIPKRSVIYTAVFLAAVIGWFLLPPLGRIRGRPVMWFLIMWTGVYVATLFDRRYVVPVQFYETFLASITGWHILSRVFSRKNRLRLNIQEES